MNWNEIVPGVVAVILAAGSVVTFFKTQKDIGKDIDNSRLNLSNEHTGLSKEHTDLSKEHIELFFKSDMLAKEQSEIKNIVKSLNNEYLRREGGKQYLSQQELNIVKTTEYLNVFKDIMLEQKKTIVHLEEENQELKHQIAIYRHKEQEDEMEL